MVLEGSAQGAGGVGVDGDGVFELLGVAAGEDGEDGDLAGDGGAVDGEVALVEAFDGQVEAAEFVVLVGV